MATFKQKLNIANFICKFGDELVLLDLCHEVVIPAFTTDEYARGHGDSKYFLHNVKIINLSTDDNPELAIAGRFIKQTSVVREQIFEDGKIIKDHQAMPSAPASFFVLLLSNHKLLYIRENAGSPLLGTFTTTIASFLRKAHRTWIDDMYKLNKNTSAPLKKVDLFRNWPLPSLEIVELSTGTDIKQFVRKFKVINAVEIRLINTNNELDNYELFTKLRTVKDDVGADQLTIKTEKPGEVGLQAAHVIDFISTPAEEANSRITIRGKDLAGDKLNGNNEQFKVAIPITTIPSDVGRAANSALAALQKQVDSGIVSIKKAGSGARTKLKRIIEDLRVK